MTRTQPPRSLGTENWEKINNITRHFCHIQITWEAMDSRYCITTCQFSHQPSLAFLSHLERFAISLHRKWPFVEIYRSQSSHHIENNPTDHPSWLNLLLLCPSQCFQQVKLLSQQTQQYQIDLENLHWLDGGYIESIALSECLQWRHRTSRWRLEG